jgi:hypothetical protein
VPRPQLPATLALDDGFQRQHPFASLDRHARFVPASAAEPAAPILAQALTDDVIDRVRSGARALLWLTGPDGRYTRDLPFWREAIHVFAPDRLWDRVPQPGHADLRFYSIATDFALDTATLSDLLTTPVRPIWRRFDARQMVWSDYVVEIRLGPGRMLATSLRLSGGLGDQPASFETNPLGAWLLSALLDRLRDD